MKLLRKLTAFILAFSLLAGTVVVMSAAVSEDEPLVSAEDETVCLEPATQPSTLAKDDLASTAASSFTPRLTAPAKTNKYYYSDKNVFYKYGWGMPNCTCYAWGRAYELLGTAPDLCVYSAYLWYDYNKDNKLYSYGATPKLGAIACWVYTSGSAGHVAVVEKITFDTVTFSNSAYGGEEFYTTTAPIDDPSDNRSTWIFQGYIYVGDYENTDTSADKPGDTATGDVYRITSDNGVNMRSGAGTGYGVIGAIAYGQDVTVTKTKKADGYTWGYTAYSGKSGWFVTDFAKLVYIKTDDTTALPETPLTAQDRSSAEAPSSVTEPKTPERTYMMGDVDADGKLTILDATRIQLIIAEMMVPTEYMLTVGDYDGDSILNIMDAGRLRHYLAFERA